MAKQFHQPSEHQEGEGEEVEPGYHRGQAFIVTHQAPKAGQPPETALDHPTPRQEHEAGLRSGELDNCQRDPRLRRILRGLRPRIAVIATGDLACCAGRRLDWCGERLDPRPIRLIGWGHRQGQEITERIDGPMPLTPAPPLGPIIPRSPATLGTRLQGPAVQKGR